MAQQIDPRTTKIFIDKDGTFSALDITTGQPVQTKGDPSLLGGNRAGIGNLNAAIEDPFGRGSDDSESLIDNIRGIFSGDNPGESLRDLVVGGPNERARMGRQAKQGLTDARNITAAALPIVAGVSTGGMSLPAAAGITGSAGMAGEAIRGGDFSMEGLSNILKEGGIEGLIEGVTRLPGSIGPRAIRAGVRMSGSPQVAEDFARETGRLGVDPATALGDAIAGTPGASLSEGGSRAVRRGMNQHLSDVRASDGADIFRNQEISGPMRREGRRIQSASEDPAGGAETVQRILGQVQEGFPHEIPFRRALDIAQGGRITGGTTDAARMGDARTRAFRDAVDNSTMSTGSRDALNARALADAIDELSPQAGLFGRGSRGDILASMAVGGAVGGGAASQVTDNPMARVAAAVAGALGTTPRNIVRAGKAANIVEPGMAPLAAGTRVERERRRQLTP